MVGVAMELVSVSKAGMAVIVPWKAVVIIAMEEELANCLRETILANAKMDGAESFAKANKKSTVKMKLIMTKVRVLDSL